jgi:hypothetical protein
VLKEERLSELTTQAHTESHNTKVQRNEFNRRLKHALRRLAVSRNAFFCGASLCVAQDIYVVCAGLRSFVAFPYLAGVRLFAAALAQFAVLCLSRELIIKKGGPGGQGLRQRFSDGAASSKREAGASKGVAAASTRKSTSSRVAPLSVIAEASSSTPSEKPTQTVASLRAPDEATTDSSAVQAGIALRD